MDPTTDNPENQPSDLSPRDADTQPTGATEQSPQDESDAGLSDGEASRAETAAVVEAILFATDSPISTAKMGTVAELPQRVIKQAIDALNERYEGSGTSIRIEELAGGYQMLTQPQFHEVLSRLLRVKSESRLSQAALETLAIVAYRQPILRADVEAIRGVACGEMLRGLMEKNLVKIVGRAEVLGRPMLYGTTKRFLEIFGLASLDDLPRVDELRTAASQVITNPAQPTSEDADDAEGASSAESAEDQSSDGGEEQAEAPSEAEGAVGGEDGKAGTGTPKGQASASLRSQSPFSSPDNAPQPTAAQAEDVDEDEFDDEDWDDEDD